MADYFAGQRFFDFYPGGPDDEEVEVTHARPVRRSLAASSRAHTRHASRGG
jgi:hypothetical protein